MGAFSLAPILVLLVLVGIVIVAVIAIGMSIARKGKKSQHVAPGWYPDAMGVIRWHDGRQWTEHVQEPRS